MEPELNWPSNYFNYFTEIEERFRQARGSGLFLLSPLDWALIETWKNAGVPLEAALRGIDEAFEKWRGRKQRFQQVNGLAYCQQAVMQHAQMMANAGSSSTPPATAVSAPFPIEDLRAYLASNAAHLTGHPNAAFREVGASLTALAENVEQHYADLEELERRLTALEEKLLALARVSLSEEQLLEARRELDRQLKPYRGKMTADQLRLLEGQFLDRQVFERAGLRRLSLFYLGA